MKILIRKIKECFAALFKNKNSDLDLEKWAALEYSKQLPRNRNQINYKHLSERK